MYIFLPVSVDYRTNRLPVVTFSIMGVCIAVFLVGAFLSLSSGEGGGPGRDPLIHALGLIPSRMSVLTLLSHMFIHGGFFHLLGNMVYLFLFGAVVEDTLGRGKFLGFYLIGGVIAAGIHILVTGVDRSIPMIGASGAISACLGGFVVLYAKTQIELRYFIWFLFYIRSGTFYLVSWVVILAWFLWDLVALILRIRSGAEGGGVAFAAHIGGMLGGFAIVALGKRWAIPTESNHEPVQVNRIQTPNVYIYHNDEELGPYSKDQVRRMVASGTISQESLYWMEGMLEWLPVGDMREWNR